MNLDLAEKMENNKPILNPAYEFHIIERSLVGEVFNAIGVIKRSQS